MGRRTVWFGWVVAFHVLALPGMAVAQGNLRVTASGGVVLSSDQRTALGFDLPVVEGDVRAGWRLHELFRLELRFGTGAFFGSRGDVGALMDLAVGGELTGQTDVGRVWGAAHFGAGVTGPLVRPVLRLAIGWDLPASDEISVGPVLTFGHVFHDDGPGQSDDASFLTLGVSVNIEPSGSEDERSEWVVEPARLPPAPARLAPPPRIPGPPASPPEILMEMLDEAAGLSGRELLVPVLFHFDSTELVACSVASLHSLRDHLLDHPEIAVLEIEGHADGSGSDEYNQTLSLERARAIRTWLIEHEVPEDRLATRAAGETAPVESNEQDTGREQNRRARFRVLLER